MEIVWCKGYESLQVAVYLKYMHPDRAYKITTVSEDIARFCAHIGWDYELIKPPRMSIRRPSEAKTFRLDFFRRHQDTAVFHFSHRYSDYWGWFLADQFSKVIPVVFYPFEELIPKGSLHRVLQYSPKSYLRMLVQNLFMRLIYHLEVGVSTRFDKEYKPTILGKFFRKREPNLRIFDMELVDWKAQLKNAYHQNQLKIVPIKSLFVMQRFPELVIHVWEKSLLELYNFLRNQNITLKRHPNHPGPGMENSKEFANYYIPTEFIAGSIQNAFLAVFSVGLVGAAYWPHLKSICLMDLVEWKSEDYKKFMRNILVTRSNNGILFPQSFEELKQLLD